MPPSARRGQFSHPSRLSIYRYLLTATIFASHDILVSGLLSDTPFWTPRSCSTVLDPTGINRSCTLTASPDLSPLKDQHPLQIKRKSNHLPKLNHHSSRFHILSSFNPQGGLDALLKTIIKATYPPFFISTSKPITSNT